jgi:hypothetical protein
MSDKEWYLAVGRQRMGPYETDQIPRLIRDGKLRRDTFVWNEAMEGWKAAGEVPELSAQWQSQPSNEAGGRATGKTEVEPGDSKPSTDTVSRMVDQVTAEVSSEVMNHLDSFTRDVAVSSPESKPAEREKAVVSAGSAPGKGAKLETRRVTVRPAAVVPPAKPAEPARGTTAAGRTPAKPADVTVTGPEAAAPASPVGARMSGMSPIPNPFTGRISVSGGSGNGTGPKRDAQVDFIRLLGTLIKIGGGIGLLVGMLSFVKAVQEASGGPVQVIIGIGGGLMSFVLSVCVLALGFLIDLWLRQAEQVRAMTAMARKDNGDN